MASLPAACSLEEGLRIAAGLGDAEEQVLGRDVLVAEPAGLGLGALERRPWRAGRARASRPGSGRAAPARPRARRGTRAGRRRGGAASRPGSPSSGSTRALSRCSASRIGLCSRWAVCLGGDDGLLGLLGESIELHRFRSLVLRGSGWSTSSRNCSRGVAGLVGQVGRQDDLGLGVQVAVAVGPEAGHALAGQPERPARSGCRPGSSAARGPSGVSDLDLAAEQRLLEGQRQLALEVGAAPGEDGVRLLADDDVEVAAARRLAGQADARAGVGALAGSSTSRRLPSISTSRVVPWYASSRVISAIASAPVGRRAGALRLAAVVAGRPAVGVEAHPGEDVLERRAAGGPPTAAGTGRRAPMRPPKNAWKKSLNSPASPVVRNS